MLDDEDALDEARLTTDIGLLNGMGVTIDQLRAIGERLQVDAIEPLAKEAR